MDGFKVCTKCGESKSTSEFSFRKDNTKGYTPENIQIVCNMYNTGKGEATEEQFLEMCMALVKREGVCKC